MPPLGIGIGIGIGRGRGAGAPFNKAGLPLWSAAVNAAKAGTKNPKLLFVGDSTVGGLQATSGNVNCVGSSFPSQLAPLLQTALGIKCSSQSRFGTLTTTTALTTVDPRITRTGSWTDGSAALAMGGSMMQSTGAGTLSFTPTIDVDTFVVRYPLNSGLPSFTLNINGGATLATVSENGAAGIGVVTVNAALGPNTLNMVMAAASTFVMEIYAYNSAAKEISVLNGGWSGSKAADWNASPAYAPLPHIGAVAPDLSIIDLTINDWVGATNTTTYQNAIQAIITKCKLSGDVLLAIGAPSKITSAPQATQDAYAALITGLATSNSLNAPINFTTALGGSWVAANAAGWMADDLHPNASGYGLCAAAVLPAIT